MQIIKHHDKMKTKLKLRARPNVFHGDLHHDDLSHDDAPTHDDALSHDDVLPHDDVLSHGDVPLPSPPLQSLLQQPGPRPLQSQSKRNY